MRAKFIGQDEFRMVLERNWSPVILEGDAIPMFARSIPEDRVDCMIASGEIQASTRYKDPNGVEGRLVGGMDIYRKSPDDPVRLNKDWYAVVEPDDGPGVLVAIGPQRDSEHWIDEVPSRYREAESISRQRRERFEVI